MIENLSLAFGIVFDLKEYIFFTIKYMVDGVPICWQCSNKFISGQQ